MLQAAAEAVSVSANDLMLLRHANSVTAVCVYADLHVLPTLVVLLLYNTSIKVCLTSHIYTQDVTIALAGGGQRGRPQQAAELTYELSLLEQIPTSSHSLVFWISLSTDPKS